MKRLHLLAALGLSAALFLAPGCGQPGATPTPAPAVPTKAAEPTKPQAPPTAAVAQPIAAPAQPTAAPAKKTDFPQKGKTITIILGYAPGSGADTIARTLAPGLEKELGVPIAVVNKVGAASQVAMTEASMAKPDGYTIAMTNLPPIITNYLDPKRKAVYTRQSFMPIALHSVDPATAAVKADSPYKTLKDLMDAAKAKPESIKAGTGGILGTGHLALLLLGKMDSAKFSLVHFEGVSQQIAPLLGGHTDVAFDASGAFLPHVKSQNVRLLGMMDKEKNSLFPDVPTFESQGYKLYMAAARGLALPAGTPQDVMDVLSAAVKKSIEDPSHKEQVEKAGLVVRYLGPKEFGAYWEQMETDLKVVSDLIIESGS